MPVNSLYIYSLADLGIPPTAVPAAGDVFTTSPTAAPDIMVVSDDDPLFETIVTAGGTIISGDLNQVLGANLVVDTNTLGITGDIVYLDSGSAGFTLGSGATIDGYLVMVVDLTTSPPSSNAVGVVTTAPVPPNTTYTYTGAIPAGPVPYAVLAPCFTRDTMIECENGPIAVQDIEEGDLVVTRNNGLQAVRWAGRRTVAGVGEMAPICFKAGVVGNAVDLRFSPMHRMLIDGPRAEVLFGKGEVLAHAAHLCDGDRIYREPCAEVEYFHILFDRHEIIRAHGCWSESFAPSEAALDAVDGQTRAELLKLFPELDQDWQDALPTLSAAEAQLVI